MKDSSSFIHTPLLRYTALYTLLFLFFSCQEQSQKELLEATEKSGQTTSIATPVEWEDIARENIQGEKRKVNPQVVEFVLSQQQLLKDFPTQGGNPKILAQALYAKNDEMITQCSVNGTSGKMVHLWLQEHMQRIAQLQVASGQSEVDSSKVRLKESLEEFHLLFEGKAD